jgi:hypothetical protein
MINHHFLPSMVLQLQISMINWSYKSKKVIAAFYYRPHNTLKKDPLCPFANRLQKYFYCGDPLCPREIRYVHEIFKILSKLILP